MPAVPDDKKRFEKCPFRVREIENCVTVFYNVLGAKKKISPRNFKISGSDFEIRATNFSPFLNRIKTRPENTDNGR